MVTITKITGNGTWQGKHGLMYSYEATFSDGEIGVINTTKPDRWKVGDEVVRVDNGTDPKGNKKFALSTPQEGGGQTFHKDPVADNHRQMLIVAQSSMDRAVQICIAYQLPATSIEGKAGEIMASVLKLAKEHDTQS